MHYLNYFYHIAGRFIKNTSGYIWLRETYSYFNDFIGFAVADLIACALTVNSAMANAAAADKINAHIDILVL